MQTTELKVGAGHRGGHASRADLKQYIAILSCSGSDWSDRMKRLAARAPNLDIVSSSYVLREPTGWQITDKGREFLAIIEARTAETAVAPLAEPFVVYNPTDTPPNVVRMAGHRVQRRRRSVAA